MQASRSHWSCISSNDVSCVMFHVSCVVFHVSCAMQASKSGLSSMSSATAKIMPRSLSLSLALARALSLWRRTCVMSSGCRRKESRDVRHACDEASERPKSNRDKMQTPIKPPRSCCVCWRHTPLKHRHPRHATMHCQFRHASTAFELNRVELEPQRLHSSRLEQAQLGKIGKKR